MLESNSPCTGVCKLEGDICVGCLRTKAEIGKWRTMALEDRMRLLEELRYRGATHVCPSCSNPAYCALEDGKSSNTCWCMTVPRDYNPDTSVDQCLCRACLTDR